VTKPTANENAVLLVATVSQPDAALLPLTRRINECGCSVVEARVSCLGLEVVVALLAVGPWDAIAKLESGVARLEREDNLKVAIKRTGSREPQASLMPYVIEVVAADRPGVLFLLAEFFASRGIAIEQLASSRYRAMQTGADMFSAQITVGIPAKTHIAALRDDFLEFCDAQNLDAIMDPMKY
jgi:glycine cleavage system transcriptional repressor